MGIKKPKLSEKVKKCWNCCKLGKCTLCEDVQDGCDKIVQTYNRTEDIARILGISTRTLTRKTERDLKVLAIKKNYRIEIYRNNKYKEYYLYRKE